jgi:hypothetical protein
MKLAADFGGRMSDSMRVIAQIISVCAIALGMGLLVGGITIDPSNRLQDLSELARTLNQSEREIAFYRDLSAALKGVGATFLTLGAFGLLVPWANVLVYGRRPNEPTMQE